MSAPAASSPATAGGTTPVDEQHDHPDQDDDRLPGAQPERDRLAADELRLVDDEDARVARPWRRGPPMGPAGAARRRRPASTGLLAEVLALALDGGHDEVAALGRHAREDPLADERRARRDDDLGQADLAVEAPAPRPSPLPAPYWSTSVRACRLRSAEIVCGVRTGSSRSPSSTTIAIVPSSSGTPTSANSKNPNASPP